MAIPIKETPILLDVDALRFEEAAQNVVPIPDDVREEMNRVYEKVKKTVEFAL